MASDSTSRSNIANAIDGLVKAACEVSRLAYKLCAPTSGNGSAGTIALLRAGLITGNGNRNCPNVATGIGQAPTGNHRNEATTSSNPNGCQHQRDIVAPRLRGVCLSSAGPANPTPVQQHRRCPQASVKRNAFSHGHIIGRTRPWQSRKICFSLDAIRRPAPDQNLILIRIRALCRRAFLRMSSCGR